jgi:hypothetical protein
MYECGAASSSEKRRWIPGWLSKSKHPTKVRADERRCPMTKTKLKLSCEKIQRDLNEHISRGFRSLKRSRHTVMTDVYADIHAYTSGARSFFIDSNVAPNEALARIIEAEIACRLAYEVVSDNWESIRYPYVKPA